MEISDLPDEIQQIILKYACSSSLKDVFNCIQVNQLWKSLIESWYVFPKSIFFKSAKTKEEFQLARISNRRYKSYVLEFSSKFVANTVWIESILKRSEKTLDEVYLTLGIEKRITEVRFEYFYGLWKLLWNMETIHIKFMNFAFDEKDVDPKRKPIVFPRLKCLDVLWNRNDYWYGLLVDDEDSDEKIEKEKKIDKEVDKTSSENKENESTDNKVESKEKTDTEKPSDTKPEPSVSDPGRVEDRQEETNKNVIVEYIEEEDQDDELEEVVARNLLANTTAPVLETIKIRVPEYYYQNALKDFFKFINKNSKNLKKIYVWNEKSYCFHWYKEYLYIWYNEEMHEEMHEGLDIFLAGRCETIKQFKLHFRFDKDFLCRIFRESRELDYFETSTDLSILEANDIFPKIKTLTIWNFQINSENILKLCSNFPCVEVLRLAHVQFGAPEIDMIKDAFLCLKDLQKYNSESNVYKSVMRRN